MSSGVPSGGTDVPNLVSEFESSYSSLVSTLVAEDDLHEKSPETLKQEEEKITKFMELARSIETFFLQKRQLIHAHKPELILKEDTLELKTESARKDELIRKHFEKLTEWQELLQDMQQGGGAKEAGQAQQPGQQQVPGGPSSGGAMRGGLGPGGSGGQFPLGGMGMNAAPGAPMQPGAGAPQGGFVPGNNYRSQHPAAPNNPMMQDPLSYLEKSASNVGGANPMSR